MNFKKHWKEAIHEWRQTDGTREQANQVEALSAAVETMQDDMASLQTKNHAYQAENNALRAQQLEIQHALQTEQCYHRHDEQSKSSTNTSSDDISALTEVISELAREVRCIKANDTSGDGRGQKYMYCWKCGGQPTHWTRKCRFLTKEQRQEYRDADGNNRTGGNEKYAD